MPNVEYKEVYQVTRTVKIIIDMALESEWTVCGYIHCTHSLMGEFCKFQIPACSLDVALPRARAVVGEYLNNFRLVVEGGMPHA